jgi:hypothetical protein
MDGYHGGNSMGQDMVEETAAIEENVMAMEEYLDPEAPTVTKIKR